MTGAPRLDPQLRTIGELFEDSDVVYTIPAYQRNFAWRAEQIEQLIDDIQDAISDSSDGYFLGNLVVTERASAKSDFEVIDGQQRLTTLHLLLTVLAENGISPSGAHQDRIRYESRPRATEALRRISSPGLHHTATPSLLHGEDTAIHQAFNVIRQFMNQHEELRNRVDRDRFADFLRGRVTVVRASLPSGIDLNRYFEVMNTRGEQLQQVDIVKARLLSHLDEERERSCFAWIWDACADMDSYVQMSLTRGDTQQRSRIFGDDWSWLQVTTFEQLLAIQQTDSARGASTSGVPASASASLDEALARYAAWSSLSTTEDLDNVRFRSTIEFPAFLLHVLKVLDEDDEEREGHLDDKRLIERFGRAVGADAAAWVRHFAVGLLRCRNLFDGFVLKRQYTATTGDDGDWSLQRLLQRWSRNRATPGYINTFSGVTVVGEEDGPVDPTTNDVLVLQSMLRVTYTSPRTMHWVTRLLRLLFVSDPSTVSGAEVSNVLRAYARDKVSEAFPFQEQPTGFAISRIVFTYLDYLLLARLHAPDYRFAFRNSIEHFYPQHPDEQQVGAVVSSERLNLLGNLALVSVGANSKFSNSLPRAKAENYQTTIETQSPKLQEMARVTRRQQGWGDQEVLAHHEEMIELLRSDLLEPDVT